MKQVRSGFILMLALMTISIGVVIVTSVYRVSQVYLSFIRRTRLQQEACQLARSGPQIVCAQLAQLAQKQFDADNKRDTSVGQSSEPKSEPKPKFSASIAPKGKKPTPQGMTSLKPTEELLGMLNSWQTFPFEDGKQSIEGTLKVYCACEQGKVDLNALSFMLQSQKKEQKKSGKSAQPKNDKLQLSRFFELLGKSAGNGTKGLKALESTLVARAYHWYDSTELVANKELEFFAKQLYPNSLAPGKKKKDKKEKKNNFALKDLFTVRTGLDGCMVPWALSASTCKLLGVPMLQTLSKEKLKLLAKKPIGRDNDPAKVWDAHLAPVYKKKWKALPKLAQKLLEGGCGATTFSVVSYAYVGGVSYGVWAIVRMVPNKGASKKQQLPVQFEIVEIINI
jgi:hypothetical protein